MSSPSEPRFTARKKPGQRKYIVKDRESGRVVAELGSRCKAKACARVRSDIEAERARLRSKP